MQARIQTARLILRPFELSDAKAAVELLDVHDIFRDGRIVIPAKYRSTVYWSVRAALAVAGGMLAVAYDVSTPVLALNVGASAGLVIRNLAKRPPVHTGPSLGSTAVRKRAN